MGIGNVFSNTNAMSIGDMLRSKVRFIVPRFQRNYAWGNEQVLELWNDITENFGVYTKTGQSYSAHAHGDSQYLLGSIVLVNGRQNQEYAVIDGQQRLATMTMLFCVVRDIIKEDLEKYTGAKPRETDRLTIQMDDLIDGLTKYSTGQGESWKLVLNEIDKDAFREIQGYENNKNTQYERIHKKLKNDSKLSDSQRHIYENYVFLHDEVSRALESGFKPVNIEHLKGRRRKMQSDKYETDRIKKRIENMAQAKDFVSYVANNNFVVQVMIDNDSTAFQVFETLNSRGSDLAKSNLIKNHILNKVGNDKEVQEDLSRKWDRIFSETVGEQDHDEFVLESLRSRNKESPHHNLTTKNIYKIIKDDLTDIDPKKCKKVVAELEEDAEFVAMLNNPKLADDFIKDAVIGMHLLRAKLIRFPIIAAQRRWSDTSKELGQLADMLLKFFFKARIVTRMHPGDLDKIMTDVTKLILNEHPSEIITKVAAKLNDEDDHRYFETEFQRFMKKPKKDTARYVLYQLDKEMSNPHTGVKPIDNLTLEHILPRKPDGWDKAKFFGGAESNKMFSDHVDRLGNLTLLELPPNSILKNKTFEEKKDYIKDGKQVGFLGSELMLNKMTVANKDEWTEKIIDEREKCFLDLAAKAWQLNL